MKLLKKIFLTISALIAVLIIAALLILFADAKKTSYLNISNIASANSNTYLITNVNIVPMHRDTILRNHMVLIENGVINEVSENIEANGVEIVDGENKFLLPGLIDMHVHVWDKYELGLYLYNGVTAVRNLWGMPMHLRMKDEIINDKIIAPMFFTSGPKLTGPEFIGDDNLNLTSPEEAEEKVISYKERGYDFIKTYYGLTKDIFDAVIEQSGDSDIDIVAHPSPKVPFSYHLHPQIKSIEHAEEFVQQPLGFKLDQQELQIVIDSLAESKHISYSPTITVFNNIYQIMLNDTILNSAPMAFMNPMIKKVDSKAQYDRWHNEMEQDEEVVDRIKKQHDFHILAVSKLFKAGVPVVAGTDSGIGVTTPGFSIHQELAFYKEAGLSNFEVLQTATINASKVHKKMNNMGSIEEGKYANLLLVDKNPLESLNTLKKPTLVFVNGRKLNAKTLDLFKEKAKNRKNMVASGLRYLENLLIEK